jgi:sulfoxide reductase catalytic subunit YedY
MKKRSWQISESEVTDKEIYLNRRNFIKNSALGSALGSLALSTPALFANQAESDVLQHEFPRIGDKVPSWLNDKVSKTVSSLYRVNEDVTPYQYVTQYNNFYEFGTDKGDPYDNATDFRTDPWSVEISGEVERRGKFTLEDILKPHDLEERIYRLRCVEAWSMVVPWIGFPLGDLVKRFKPTAKAKYIRFKTLFDPGQMPGQHSAFTSIDYPYVEGLRMDEAMNELAFLSVGLYGDVIPPQNGAPLRLVVPWKYGFKSIKSIVKIEFLSRRPRTTWEISNSREYGFYANVNPEVNHPRWSQATERRLPGSLFRPNRRDTLMFNGYGEQVAVLYKDLDLKKNF